MLVTHEHADHNGVETIGGDPAVLRSTAGRLESPLGEVVAIASEHDEAAGTQRGPNTIFVFGLDGVRIAHFGDFGQSALREEQAAAIGQVDLVFLPVGAGPTIGPEQASVIVERLSPRWVVPMHYRTERISFLDPADPFLELMPHVHRVEETGFDTDSLTATSARSSSCPLCPSVSAPADLRQRLAPDALQVTQIVEMRSPGGIPVEVACHPHRVDVSVEQLVHELRGVAPGDDRTVVGVQHRSILLVHSMNVRPDITLTRKSEFRTIVR